VLQKRSRCLVFTNPRFTEVSKAVVSAEPNHPAPDSQTAKDMKQTSKNASEYLKNDQEKSAMLVSCWSSVGRNCQSDPHGIGIMWSMPVLDLALKV